MQYGDFARLYDRLMADVDYDMWADYICALIKKCCTDAKSVCECACGTGKITVRLKKRGFNVTGFDISTQMLEIAAQNARNAGVIIPFVCMDMQKLTLHRPCDAVVCSCDGVNYLVSESAVKRFFHRSFASLKSGGVLLFDISSQHKLKNVLGCNTFAEDEGDCAYIWKNMYDTHSSLIEMNLSFFERVGDTYIRFTERHIQKAHSIDKLVAALHECGFAKVDVYDAFTENAPTSQSERIQFIAYKV